jgi:CheY-like chemotaxis protein
LFKHIGHEVERVQILEELPDFAGIIVADDDAMIRSVVRSTLEAIGQTVLLASDGLEAVELASRMRARLIMLDLRMPRLNGLLACQQIRQLPHNAKTPIVILTSLVRKDAEAAASRTGATAFLAKPFRSAELLQALSGFLTISDTMRTVIKSAADRAGGIARTAPAPSGNINVASVGPNDAFNRGKNILTVLRP